MPSVKDNIRIHDTTVKSYERVHREIFNELEQERLRSVLEFLAGTYLSKIADVEALDFGSGTGNVTRHLQEIGFTVTAADVSPKSLEYVIARFGCKAVLLKEGSTLSLKSETYDFVVAYSVLHHIPDYIATLSEFGRICKPGGIVFIDHEASPHYWRQRDEVVAVQSEISRVDIRKFFRLRNYVHKVATFFNPRHAVEGDIHVWPDDHIEWDRIEIEMERFGFKKIFSEDFLVYNSIYRPEEWFAVKDLFSDTRCSAYQKSEK